MFYILLLWLSAQILVAVLNYFSSKVHLDVSSVLILLLKMAPIIFLSNLLFILYFWIWTKYIKFWVLSVISVTFWIILSILVQYFLLKQSIDFTQIIWTLIVLIWIFILNYNKIFN